MSLVLTLEHAPSPQAVRQMRLEEGELVIGRGADADWRIEDPDMFVSRAHCRISGAAGRFTVTDTSSGGLFLDDARQPLGPDSTVALCDGMTLRMGDFVLRVSLQGAEAAARPSPSRAAPAFDSDDFFSTRPEPEARPVRPPDLPEQFERPVRAAERVREERAAERGATPFFDDPFTLEPLPSAPRPAAEAWPETRPETRPEPRPEPPPISTDFDWGLPAEPQREPGPPAPVPRPEPAAASFAPETPAPARSGVGADAALAAFCRGLGIGAAELPGGDPEARMEAFGREYRLMLEGLMELLRKRAQEKSNARIAQTVVGAAEVNPLKFMPSPEAALETMLRERSPGFLDAEAAIAGAVRDLALHHVAAWRGVQTALRRMVDRFDPAALEEELKTLSRIETLLAGGRSAKLWALYEERYREIAHSAETRFLGEVGADFRDAYESEGD
jgi:type VI secretion system protein ImpI